MTIPMVTMLKAHGGPSDTLSAERNLCSKSIPVDFSSIYIDLLMFETSPLKTLEFEWRLLRRSFALRLYEAHALHTLNT